MTADGIPTKVLMDEHQHVLKKLSVMEGLLGNLEQKDKISTELKGLAYFFKNDFWLHFDKEELALFPELGNYIPRNAGPLQMMFTEHKDLRNTNEVLQHALAEYSENKDMSITRETIHKAGMGFIHSLRSHIDKENSMMFTLANVHLTKEQEDDIMRVFTQIDASAAKLD